MNLYEAVRSRRSVRSYKNIQVSRELIHGLKMYVGRIMPLDKNIKTEFVFFGADDKEIKLKGPFRIRAPHFLALFSQEVTGWAVNAGYMLEQMVLYMAAKGLGSCYMGAARLVGPEKEGMRLAAVLAFGYADRELYREQSRAKRLDLKELCVFSDGTEEDISPDTEAILQAARLAPSAFNFQPWRFVVCRDRIHVFVCRSRLAFKDSTRIQGLNMGIVLSHMMLAAEEQWVTASVVKEEELSDKEYRKGRYICTVAFV
ncbi:nitroreductase family protein [Lachnospiraceae bacterium 62-35]